MNYDKLQKSLRHLELQYRNLESQGARAELNYLDREAIQESVIQRFVVCYDMMWKHIRRHLIDELGLPERDMPNSPKPVFRIAHQNHLLADIDAWLNMCRCASTPAMITAKRRSETPCGTWAVSLTKR